VKKAKTGKGGQLDTSRVGLPRSTGLLIVGVMYPDPVDIATLESAARSLLNRTGRDRPGLSAITFVIVSAYVGAPSLWVKSTGDGEQDLYMPDGGEMGPVLLFHCRKSVLSHQCKIVKKVDEYNGRSIPG
jgi:hypothetical protein